MRIVLQSFSNTLAEAIIEHVDAGDEIRHIELDREEFVKLVRENEPESYERYLAYKHGTFEFHGYPVVRV